MRYALLLLRAYRLFLSPFLHLLLGSGAGCRFQPSCSDYSEQAFRTRDLVSAFLLTVRRLSRCHPWSQGGYDPVPESNACSTTACCGQG